MLRLGVLALLCTLLVACATSTRDLTTQERAHRFSEWWGSVK